MSLLPEQDLSVLETFKSRHADMAQLHQGFLEEYSSAYDTMPPRFVPGCDPTRIFSREKFEYTLGIDVAHATHPVSQLVIAELMLPYLSLSLKDAKRLRFAELVHDYGEAVVGIDIPFGTKTIEDDEAEQAAWDTAIATIGGKFTTYIQTEIRPILTGEDERMHHIFDVSERVGYIATGIRAGSIAFDPSITDDFTAQELGVLQTIARNVYINNVQYVQTHRQGHPILHDIVTQNTFAWETAALAAQAE